MIETLKLYHQIAVSRIVKKDLYRFYSHYGHNPAEGSYKESVLNNFAKFSGKYLLLNPLLGNFLDYEAFNDFITGVFLRILQNFSEHFFIEYL